MMEIAKWLITVLVGGAIAFSWQQRGWIFQQRLKRSSDLYEEQLSVCREIFALVDKRLYASRTYLSELVEATDGWEDERSKYRAVVFEWNEKVAGLTTVVVSRFDSDLGGEFDLYFPPSFAEVDRNLRKLRVSVQNGEPLDYEIVSTIRGNLDVINMNAREFMDKMLFRTKQTLRVVDNQHQITLNNTDRLSYYYLIKSLFVSRHKT
jgi:hypothetical protein